MIPLCDFLRAGLARHRCVLPSFVLAAAATLAACASSAALADSTGLNAPPVDVIVGTPPWPYRLGQEIFAAVGTDAKRIHAELAHKAAALGCHAVVSIVIPASAASDKRPWGFCAYRVPPPT